MDYGYVYYAKNEINGKMYIGKVTSRTLFYKPEYKGSGVDLQKAFEEYGKRNFSIHYLATAQDGNELSWLEKYYLKYYNIPNDKFYNKNLATSNSEQSEYFNKNNSKGVNLKNIICFNYKTLEQIVFNNLTQFCKNNGLSRGCVFNVLSGQRITHKDFVFWYEDCPISDDAINWIINYKMKTNYKTKYIKISEVKEELNACYKKIYNKKEYEFKGYLIEDNKEVEVQWDLIKRYTEPLTEREGELPFEEKRIENYKIISEIDNKFEKPRECEYALVNSDKTLYFNYDEINNLTKIYSDISPRLLRQAINRKQKTVMNKKYKLKIFEGAQ